MTKKNEPRKYDAIVCGAGPAGCTSALCIANHGLEVLLVDKTKFPRDKVCGDGLTCAAVDFLDSHLHLLPKIERLNHWRINGLTASSPDGHLFKRLIPNDGHSEHFAYILPRQELDYLLLQEAKANEHIDVIEEFEVLDLMFQHDRITGIKGRQDGKYNEISGSYIVGADGVHSTVAQKLSLKNTSPTHGAFAIRAYFENAENLDNTVNLHFDKSFLPGYGWVFPAKNGIANAGVITFDRYISPKKTKELFNDFIAHHKYAKQHLQNSKMIKGTLKGWRLPLGMHPVKRGRKNVLLVGDAGSFIDPLTGEGIYYSLKTGFYAAEAIVSAFKGDAKADLLPAYEKLWKKEFRWSEYISGRILQTLFKYPSIIDWSFRKVIQNPKKADVFVQSMLHIIPKLKILFLFL